jgi:dTDP-4-dehydrorhamnose 3,5-epimerase-like enzyme
MPVEFEQMPFVPRRVFTVSNVSAGTVRGGHGHRFGRQLLFCLEGRIEIELRYSSQAAQMLLKPDGCGLLFEPGVWCQQRYLQTHTVMLALASEPYDPTSYFVDEHPGSSSPTKSWDPK